MTQRKGEKPTISIQEHMAIDVCPGPIQPIKQISDYFPRYPRGLPLTVPPQAGHARPVSSALSASSATAAESDRSNEDKPDRACAGASASSQATRRDEEPDVEGYDSDDSSELTTSLSCNMCVPFSFLSLITAYCCFFFFWPPVARHPSSSVALWLLNRSPFLLSHPPSPLFLPSAVWICMRTCCVSLRVRPCAAANSLPLSRQTANCCCREEYCPPFSFSFSSPSALLQMKR